MISGKYEGKLQPPAPGPPAHLSGTSALVSKKGKPAKLRPTDSESVSAIDETISFWAKRTGKMLSGEEAAEVIANINNFFQVLAEWDIRTRKREERPQFRHGGRHPGNHAKERG